MTTKELQEAITRWHEENPEDRKILAFIDCEGQKGGVREGSLALLGVSPFSATQMLLEAEDQSNHAKLIMHTYTMVKSMKAIEEISSSDGEEKSSNEAEEEPLAEMEITKEERESVKSFLGKLLGL